MLNKTIILLLVVLFFSCNSNTFFAEYHNIENGWHKNNKIDFSFKTPDTINKYDIFIHLRNNEKYPFSNIFLIANMSLPNNEIISDTLEYKMAEANGNWLGEGFSLKESKLWYKENVTFPAEGECKLTIEHAMRKNGEIAGLEVLQGITDVGITIENKK
ncbi:gliding motility lipoprotein GldH [Abyssalbus ytuae]|uniref:Gliding motility lipoprotein GldH n=1 Tax=Abyssalbus ytuae TaxID=2926907 RepID=A0A9E6ZNT3_9FLAO|nr:gliding motility lipoprotein GldH [Abyssalbus ytuae]UOB15948.1 gliding motility lipoprotein GldH [Abyssalbus ytuae]